MRKKWDKPKFDKTRCLSCVYRMDTSNVYQGDMPKGGKRSIICNYAGVTGHTCLKREGNRIIDQRGEDYKGCKLYKEGARLETRSEGFDY